MSETAAKGITGGAPAAPGAKPYPSWPELLAQVGRNRPDYRAVEAPPAREWRDVVATMITGRR